MRAPASASAVLALAALLALPRLAPAQAFPLNGHGRVASVVTISRQTDLAFGAALAPGVAAAVAPANGARVRIDYNEPASVTAPDFISISGPGGATVRVDLACAHDASPSAAAPTAFANPCAGGFIPPIAGNVGGTHYLYVGGTIGAGVTATVPAGSYTGSFTVTATYVAY